MITQDRLKELLSYNVDTGEFVWLNRKSKQFNSVFAGKVAGTNKSCEYTRINVDGKIYKAHRLAWLYVHGRFPDGEIDHINHNTTDNRICNLREVTHHQNGLNQSLKINSKTGVSGVNWHSAKECWSARISKLGKRVHLGDFRSFFEAVCARKSAEKMLGYHTNHGI